MEQKIEIEKNLVRFYFKYDEKLKEILKERFEAVWNKKLKCWETSGNIQNLVELILFAEEYNFSISKKFAKIINEEIDKRLKLSELSKYSEGIDLDKDRLANVTGELRPFQTAVIPYIELAQSCIIADEQGLGKTIEAIVSVEYHDIYPCIVVCPKNLKLNWESEIHSWLKNRKVKVLPTTEEYADVDFIIVHYDALDKHSNELLKFNARSIIFDEAHYIKNSASKRSKIAKKISKKIEHIISMTGTPIMNRPSELISQLTILKKINEFGGNSKFAFKYCDAHFGRWGLDTSGHSNLGELNLFLRSSCLIRRLKKDVAKDLPPKVRTRLPFVLDNRSDYEDAMSDLKNWLIESKKKDEDFINSLKGLKDKQIQRRAKDEFYNIGRKVDNSEAIIKIEKLKQICALGKLNSAIEWISDFIESEKLVLFAIHKVVLKKLKEAFPKAVTIFSEDSIEQINNSKKKFQGDESCRLIICALGSSASSSPGGIGHTLHAASNVAFLEFGWNAAIHDQAEDRIHRIGQKSDSVNCWYLIGDNTIDNETLRLCDLKRSVVNEILGETDEAQINDKNSILNGLIDFISKKM